MKMRHVRAVAVAAAVVVALTGARRSDGGGCDDSSSSSSSSSGGYSSGGSSDYDDDDDYQSSTGDYGSTPSAGPTTPAESDIRITDCVISGVSTTQAKITWKYTITNGDGSGSADYSGTFAFNDSTGDRLGSAFFSHDAVAVGTPYEGTEETTVYDDDVSTLQGRCEVSSVIKSPSL
ncbi:hypothetical protein QIS99_09790 [Streptomyces sp. B-S-A8]|uniref:Secreted protein n=1 Tax=Streptomyces solicavernae TaxID=3043614 RepID=A0ABT6RQ07_9ACTN|nr:hypothetical protein [Streptomyces sp. B-S-A8]MDI3386503.1 hypothetical protein [Streptomyces sp. B-S-A8]